MLTFEEKWEKCWNMNMMNRKTFSDLSLSHIGNQPKRILLLLLLIFFSTFFFFFFFYFLPGKGSKKQDLWERQLFNCKGHSHVFKLRFSNHHSSSAVLTRLSAPHNSQHVLSQTVTRPSTNHVARCLTLVVRWELVCSTFYCKLPLYCSGWKDFEKGHI